MSIRLSKLRTAKELERKRPQKEKEKEKKWKRIGRRRRRDALFARSLLQVGLFYGSHSLSLSLSLSRARTHSDTLIGRCRSAADLRFDFCACNSVAHEPGAPFATSESARARSASSPGVARASVRPSTWPPACVQRTLPAELWLAGRRDLLAAVPAEGTDLSIECPSELLKQIHTDSKANGLSRGLFPSSALFHSLSLSLTLAKCEPAFGAREMRLISLAACTFNRLQIATLSAALLFAPERIWRMLKQILWLQRANRPRGGASKGARVSSQATRHKNNQVVTASWLQASACQCSGARAVNKLRALWSSSSRSCAALCAAWRKAAFCRLKQLHEETSSRQTTKGPPVGRAVLLASLIVIGQESWESYWPLLALPKASQERPELAGRPGNLFE